MKKIQVIILASGLLLLACGGAEESDEQAPLIAEEQDAAVEETPVEAPPPPLYPEGTVDPSMITADTPVSAAALFESYFIWDGKKVTLEGYPHIFYSDTMIIEDELKLVAEPGGREVLATISFTDIQGITVNSSQPVTVSGTVEYYWTGDLELADGALVDNAPPAQSGVITSPYVYDGEVPLKVNEFFNMFNAWTGKEIIVEGYYHSTTTSTTSYGVTVRVDLSDPDDTYAKYAACEMAVEIPEGTDSTMVANRAGTQIRGTVEGESFGMVGLENCQLVNR